ncbi:MAG: hypothetical protein NBV67_02410 [Tagaea sp.]|nr:hypothetical protein [Tagaea sp.]
MTLIAAPTAIATVPDMLAGLMRRFPKHVQTIEAWGSSYRRVLGHLQPARLEAVFAEVVDAWEYNQPPKPADFAKALGAIPTADGGAGKRAADAHQALLAKANRRDELARRLARDTREHYAPWASKAAEKWGVDIQHVERAMFRDVGATYGTPDKTTRAGKAATEAIFKGAPEPAFIEIDLSNDAWAKYKRLALALSQQPVAEPEIIPPGQHSIAKPPREWPEEEARRRDIIARAEREAEFAGRDPDGDS